MTEKLGTIMPLEEWVEIYKALGDKSRLTIYSLLLNRALCVCEIVNHLGMTQSAVSQHLRRLKTVDLVKERKEGQWVVYWANEDKASLVSGGLKQIQHMARKSAESVSNMRATLEERCSVR